jgi:hypothetical protein
MFVALASGLETEMAEITMEVPDELARQLALISVWLPTVLLPPRQSRGISQRIRGTIW